MNKSNFLQNILNRDYLQQELQNLRNPLKFITAQIYKFEKGAKVKDDLIKQSPDICLLIINNHPIERIALSTPRYTHYILYINLEHTFYVLRENNVQEVKKITYANSAVILMNITKKLLSRGINQRVRAFIQCLIQILRSLEVIMNQEQQILIIINQNFVDKFVVFKHLFSLQHFFFSIKIDQ